MKKKAIIFTISSVVFISVGSILVRLSNAPSLVISMYRMFFSVIILLPIVYKNNKNDFRKISKKDFILCIISGFFLAIHFGTWITSLNYTTIASSTVLVSTHPIIILIAGHFLFKEKITKPIFFSVLISLLGSFLISFSGFDFLNLDKFLGNSLAVAGAMAVSVYILIGKKVRKNLNVNIYTFLVYSISTVFLFFFAIIAKNDLFNYSVKEWSIFLALAVFCNLLGHSVFNWALGYLKSSLVSIIIISEPIFATIWAIFLFSEVPSINEIIGGIMIIGGIVKYILIESKMNLETRGKNEVV